MFAAYDAAFIVKVVLTLLSIPGHRDSFHEVTATPFFDLTLPVSGVYPGVE